MPYDPASPSQLFVQALLGEAPDPNHLASLDPTWQTLIQAAQAATPEFRRATLLLAKSGQTDLGRLHHALTSPQSPPPPAWPDIIPFGQKKLPQFPDRALPHWLGNIIRSEARATQTPTDLAGLLSLAVLATACAGRVAVNPWGDWHEPLNLFTIVALPPGHRKSAVFSSIVQPLQQYEAEAAQVAAPQIAEARRARHAAEQALVRAEAAVACASDEQHDALLALAQRRADDLATLELPVVPRLIVDDCSPERLAMLMHQQGGRLAILSPEGGIFDLIAGRYSTTGAPNLDHVLKGHAGDPIIVDRVGRPGEIIPHPALTIGLAVQPEVLRGLIARPGFYGRGLLARFLYAVPATTLGHRDVDAEPVPEGLRIEYRRHIHALLHHLPALTLPARTATVPRTPSTPAFPSTPSTPSSPAPRTASTSPAVPTSAVPRTPASPSSLAGAFPHFPTSRAFPASRSSHSLSSPAFPGSPPSHFATPGREDGTCSPAPTSQLPADGICSPSPAHGAVGIKGPHGGMDGGWGVGASSADLHIATPDHQIENPSPLPIAMEARSGVGASSSNSPSASLAETPPLPTSPLSTAVGRGPGGGASTSSPVTVTQHPRRSPPLTLPFTSDAATILRNFARTIEPRLAPTGDLDPIVDWASKLVGATARIAGLLHLAEHAPDLPEPPPPVSPEAVEAACTIAEYLIAHARAAYDAMGLDPELAHAPVLLGWLQRSRPTSFTRRDARRALRTQIRADHDLDDALDQLEAHRYIRLQPANYTFGRPRSPTYDVHPSLVSIQQVPPLPRTGEGARG